MIGRASEQFPLEFVLKTWVYRGRTDQYLGHCCPPKIFHQEGLFCLASGGDPGSTTPFLRFLSNLIACHDFLLLFLSTWISTDSSSIVSHFGSSIQGSFSWTTCSTSGFIISRVFVHIPGIRQTFTRLVARNANSNNSLSRHYLNHKTIELEMQHCAPLYPHNEQLTGLPTITQCTNLLVPRLLLLRLLSFR